MNLVLFRADECAAPMPPDDPRTRHVLGVLRRQPGESFDCGMINGPRGRARVLRHDDAGLHLAFTWDEETPPPLAPITLLVGLPRPQTARKIIGEATTLGVSRLVFFRAERAEPSYADSTLWSSGEVERLATAAAAQAFCTRLPDVVRSDSLDMAITQFGSETATRLALDNYEATCGLGEAPLRGSPAILAIGPERGWSGPERDSLRGSGFVLAHLGTRVLRSETACTAGLAILKTRLGLW